MQARAESPAKPYETLLHNFAMTKDLFARYHLDSMVKKLYRVSSLQRVDDSDPRGRAFKIRLSGGVYPILEMVKGSLRGGHYHTRETFHIVLNGRIRFLLVNTIGKEQAEIVGSPIDIVHIPAGVAHLLEALEDSLFMESPNKGGTVDFEPQRKRVREQLITARTKIP